MFVSLFIYLYIVCVVSERTYEHLKRFINYSKISEKKWKSDGILLNKRHKL